jgi:RND family efflux transporter MFP subunit
MTLARVASSLALIATVLASVPARPARAADLDCLIQPREVVAISSPVEGLVERVAVERGDRVQEGMVLVVLESSTERAAVAIARYRAEQESGIKSNQVRLEFGDRRFQRTDVMYKQELIPLKEMDEAETGKILAEVGLLEAQENRRLAELDLHRAEAVLALRTIKSPITGVVIERLLSAGEFAKQAPILRLAQIDPLRVEVFAPIALLGRIAVGQRAQIIPEGPLNQPLEASVTVVDRVADAASGTFGVRLELPNPEHRVTAGLKCKVRFPGVPQR